MWSLQLALLSLAAMSVSALEFQPLSMAQIRSNWEAEMEGSEDLSSLCRSPPANRSLSAWEGHYCDAVHKNYVPLCIPQRRLPASLTSPGNNDTVKGMILFLHGFSACPDGAQHYMHMFQEKGYITLSPVMPGHGKPRWTACNETGADCVEGYEVSGLPKDKKGYFEHAYKIQNMIREEVARIPAHKKSPHFQVTVIGHSIGAVVSKIVAATGKERLVDNLFVLTGVFGLSDPGTDVAFLDCLGRPTYQEAHQCFDVIFGKFLGQVKKIAKIPVPLWLLKWFASSSMYTDYDRFVDWERNKVPLARRFKKLVNQTFSWESCKKEADTGRGGFCNFRYIHALATLEAGSDVIADSFLKKIPKSTRIRYVNVRSDQYTRLRIAFEKAKTLKSLGYNVSFCVFPSASGCSPDATGGNNTCGIPHGMFSTPQNLIHPPYEVYWEDGLLNEITRFARGENVGPVPDKKPYTFASLTAGLKDVRTSCVSVPVEGKWEEQSLLVGYPKPAPKK